MPHLPVNALSNTCDILSSFGPFIVHSEELPLWCQCSLTLLSHVGEEDCTSEKQYQLHISFVDSGNNELPHHMLFLLHLYCISKNSTLAVSGSALIDIYPVSSRWKSRNNCWDSHSSKNGPFPAPVILFHIGPMCHHADNVWYSFSVAQWLRVAYLHSESYLCLLQSSVKDQSHRGGSACRFASMDYLLPPPPQHPCLKTWVLAPFLKDMLKIMSDDAHQVLNMCSLRHCTLQWACHPPLHEVPLRPSEKGLCHAQQPCKYHVEVYNLLLVLSVVKILACWWYHGQSCCSVVGWTQSNTPVMIDSHQPDS